MFFHAVTSAKTEILRIELDFPRLRSSASRRTFNLARPVEGVAVDVTLYRHRQINRPNCSDVVLREVGAPPNPPEVWRSIAGRLEVERGSKGIGPDEPWLFRAMIRLTGAKFRGPGDRVVEMPNPFTWEGFVGWQAG